MEFIVVSKPNVIYKRGAAGEVRVWRMEIGLNEDGMVGAHRVIAGVYTGKMVTSDWTVCEPKNVGRANETTSHQQAHAEVAALYAKKLELAYFSDLDDIDNVRFTDPMLAHDYTERKSKIDIGAGVYAQPKLDGIRCIARADGLFTRKGKAIVAVPHIEEALAPYFKQNPQAILDGELYHHQFRDDFNLITSIVRKSKPTPADIARAKDKIQYHVYDCVGENEFSRRTGAVSDAVSNIGSPAVVAVQTFRVATQERLDELYGQWLEEGYEGQMVRLDGIEYQMKRSNALLKRKEFLTDEFPVLRIEEGSGNWSGAAKRFALTLPYGREFGAGVRGKKEVLEALWQEGNTPTWATVRYFTPTPDGVPRFPVVIDWGFGDSRDD